MAAEQVKADLQALQPAEFVSRWFDERGAHLFSADRAAHLAWRRTVAHALGVSWLDVVLVGSACVGVSLNPDKAFKPFDADSDIDVAVVSAHHFDVTWRWMRRLGAQRYRLPPRAREWIKEHEKRLVYWGSVATDQLLPHVPFGSEWVTQLAAASKVPPVDGREVNVRIYRDHASLESYLVMTVKRLRVVLAEQATRGPS